MVFYLSNMDAKEIVELQDKFIWALIIVLNVIYKQNCFHENSQNTFN
jgi:hypothetical protein